MVATGCSSSTDGGPGSIVPRIVVSHALLGAVTSEIVGPQAEVLVLIPNGVDPHVYEPSAQDIEALHSADLVVVNGLGLEARLGDALRNVRAERIPIFTATDHIQMHEASDTAGPHDGHMHRDDDPHFWTDPRLMAEVVDELGKVLEDMGLDIGDRARMYSERLLTFDQEMLARVESLPPEKRVLVTGHESLGYFAERYGFEILGTIVPGLTSGAEVSAANLAAVKNAVEKAGVDVVFTELGTPSASARVLSDELGVDVVEISTHVLSEDALASGLTGSTYIAFVERLVETIVGALEK